MEEKKITIKGLGILAIKDVIIFYDSPKLFSCQNSSGQNYLSVCIDDDGQEERWLYLPISELKLHLVMQGKISLYAAYTDPEDKFLWNVKMQKMFGIGIGEIITSADLNDDDLPDKDSFLNYEEDELMPKTHDDLQKQSALERRDIFDLSLQDRDGHKSEINCDALGAVLINFQSFIYTIANKGDSKKGKLPKKVKIDNTVQATGFFAASFGTRISP